MEPRAEPCHLLRARLVCNSSVSCFLKKEAIVPQTATGSRPMSPEEQIRVMLQEEMEIESKEPKPSKSDLEVRSRCFLSLRSLLASQGF